VRKQNTRKGVKGVFNFTVVVVVVVAAAAVAVAVVAVLHVVTASL